MKLPGVSPRDSRRLVVVALRRHRRAQAGLGAGPLPRCWSRCWRHQFWLAWLSVLLEQPVLTVTGSVAVPSYAFGKAFALACKGLRLLG